MGTCDSFTVLSSLCNEERGALLFQQGSCPIVGCAKRRFDSSMIVQILEGIFLCGIYTKATACVGYTPRHAQYCLRAILPLVTLPLPLPTRWYFFCLLFKCLLFSLNHFVTICDASHSFLCHKKLEWSECRKQ